MIIFCSWIGKRTCFWIDSLTALLFFCLQFLLQHSCCVHKKKKKLCTENLNLTICFGFRVIYTVQSSQLDHFYTNKKLHKSLHFCLNNYKNEKVTYKVTYKISFPDKCFLRRGIVKRHETFNFVGWQNLTTFLMFIFF